MILIKATKNTFQVKEVLKKKNFMWNSKEGCWELLLNGRKEYYSFMSFFLDGTKEREEVVFKAYEVDDEDIKPERQKEFEKLKETLLNVEEVKLVEEIKDEKRIGLKIIAAKERIFWYEDVNIKNLESEIDSYEIILNELARNHNYFVKCNNLKKLQEEKWIQFFCIPLYKFLVNQKKRLKKKQRKYYEEEIEVIEKHIPEKKNPVNTNEITSLKSE